MKESFITKRFNADAMDMIQKVNRILKEYAAQGFDLTLRQLYYQMVARNWFPENRRWNLDDGKWVKDPQGTKNAEPNYKWLGGIVNDGRMAGMIDWDMIKDRAREMVCPAHWDTPADIVDAAASQFRINRWPNSETQAGSLTPSSQPRSPGWCVPQWTTCSIRSYGKRAVRGRPICGPISRRWPRTTERITANAITT